VKEAKYSMSYRPAIRLEPFEEADIGRLVEWIPSAAFLLQWAGPVFKFPLDRAQLFRHLRRVAYENPTLLVYKAIDEDTGRVIGHGEIGNIDYRNHCGTLCRILIGPQELRGRGFGVQLVRYLLELAFDQLALHRVDLYVFDFNIQAVRCYEAAGFRKEGLMREARRHGDEYWNSCVMGILEHEWRELTKPSVEAYPMSR